MNRFFRFIQRLEPSDRAIAGVLSIFVLIALFAGLASLLRAYQVAIPAHGGTLSEGVVGSPRFANPLLAISDSDRDLVELTYAGLMGHSADGTLIPVLAESYTVSPDGTIYTFVLRPNAMFSDGTPVTADDVTYTIQKAQDAALKSPVYASWANIRAEATDARTIRFTLSKAYAPFLEDTTLGILPKHVWQDVSDEEFAFDTHNIMPIGAGPFIAKSTSRDSDGTITSYTLTAAKNYAIGEPYLSRIKLSFFGTQQELAEAYKNGQVKSAYGIPHDGALTAPYARMFGVFFNSEENAALKDLGVRKALSLSIDRTKLTKELLGGYATPLDGPIPRTNGSASSSAARLLEARTALTDAGYEHDESANTWSKDGEPLSMKLVTSNVPELKAVADQVQDDWQTLGVPTKLELHDPTGFTQDVIRPRAYSALLFGEVIGTTPDLYAFWSSTERTGSGLNIANYSNTDVDALLTKYRTQTDPSARTETLTEASALIAADYPAAFLYTPTFVYDAQPGIQGISLSGLSSPSDRFWNVSNWYRYTEHVWPVFVPTTR